jgi:hypothetical protein
VNYYCGGYLCSCESNRRRLDGEKRVLKVNARACVAENHVPVDLWMHRRRHMEKRDGDPTCEIWMWVRKDPRNSRIISAHGERALC